MQFARILASLACLAFSSLSVPAYASLLQWTYSGVAFLSATGEKGIETVTYTWNTDDVTFAYQTPSCWPREPQICGDGWAEVYGRAQWHGLANGGDDHVLIASVLTPDPLRLTGGTYSYHVGPLAQMIAAYPSLFSPEFDATFPRFSGSEFNIFGGEDGWQWNWPGFTLIGADQVLNFSLHILAPRGVPEPRWPCSAVALIVAALIWKTKRRRT